MWFKLTLVCIGTNLTIRMRFCGHFECYFQSQIWHILIFTLLKNMHENLLCDANLNLAFGWGLGIEMLIFIIMDSIQVSQKLMVQGYSGHQKYNGGLDVARKIIKSDGIRGLYRGFGLSVMTYAPSSAVWWASYGSNQRFIWRWDMLVLFSSFLFYTMLSTLKELICYLVLYGWDSMFLLMLIFWKSH